MADNPNELILKLFSLTLSAKGRPALWLVLPVSAILIAVAFGIVMAVAR
jgi:hypothetical protein